MVELSFVANIQIKTVSNLMRALPRTTLVGVIMVLKLSEVSFKHVIDIHGVLVIILMAI